MGWLSDGLGAVADTGAGLLNSTVGSNIPRQRNPWEQVGNDFKSPFRSPVSDVQSWYDKKINGGHDESGNFGPFGQLNDIVHPPKPVKSPLDIMREQLQSQADKFQQNSGLLKRNMFENFAQQERRGLANRLTTADEGANRRGVLYSGINEGNKSALQGESSKAMAEQQIGINKGVDDASRQLQANAAKADLQSVDMSQNLEDAVYSNALQNMQLRNQGIQSFLGGIGMLGGAYLGGGFRSGPGAASTAPQVGGGGYLGNGNYSFAGQQPIYNQNAPWAFNGGY